MTDASAPSLRRYAMVHDPDPSYRTQMLVRADGKYVLHSDAAAEIDRLTAVLAATRDVAAKYVSDAIDDRQQINALEAALAAMTAERDRMQAALSVIKEWKGLPSTGRFWPDGLPISFEYLESSWGQRDYMRGIARAALTPETPHDPSQKEGA